MLKLRKSKYLENEFIYKLKIDESIYQYEIFEKVFLAIAEDNKVKWQKIYKATQKDIKLYTLLCESIILIDKLLRIEFRMSLNNRERLLGEKFNNIVVDYYKFL